jgi:hypothetical protein
VSGKSIHGEQKKYRAEEAEREEEDSSSTGYHVICFALMFQDQLGLGYIRSAGYAMVEGESAQDDLQLHGAIKVAEKKIGSKSSESEEAMMTFTNQSTLLTVFADIYEKRCGAYHLPKKKAEAPIDPLDVGCLPRRA